MKTRIIKREYSTWESHKEICLNHVEYKLQYEKNFIGIKYWKDFKETFCGMGDRFTSTIWMNDKDLLINRFYCHFNKDKYNPSNNDEWSDGVTRCDPNEYR